MKKKEIHTPKESSELGRVVADHACATPPKEPYRFDPGLVH